MRIDNYAYASPSPLYGAVDFMEPEDAEEVSRWRGHDALHAWMARLYAERGGIGRFNLATVQVTAEDIEALAAALQRGDLASTLEDRAFIARARALLLAGKNLYYFSFINDTPVIGGILSQRQVLHRDVSAF